MLELLKNHLRKKCNEIADVYNTTPDNIKICWQNDQFTYQVIIDGVIKTEKPLNL